MKYGLSNALDDPGVLRFQRSLSDRAPTWPLWYRRAWYLLPFGKPPIIGFGPQLGEIQAILPGVAEAN